MGRDAHAACRVLLMVCIVAAAVEQANAQTPLSPPRTPDGKPNLEGVWDYRTQIPLERPKEMGSRAFLTAQEIADLRAKLVTRGPERDSWALIEDNERSSVIIDPPDGRLPPLQPGVKPQVGSLNEDIPASRPVRYRGAGMSADNPEDRGPAERCLLGFNSGPPIVPGGYNQNIQIAQSRDHVVIVNEMVHDARIVPLDGRPHLPGHIRQWMGDSVGRWDGDTLVVETSNFTDKTSAITPNVWTSLGNGANLRLTERFRLVAADRLEYEYTVDEPSTFTRPFTGLLTMKRGDVMYEYACHEANYGLQNILRGGRARDGQKPEVRTGPARSVSEPPVKSQPAQGSANGER